jgi:membrane protein implicated in regulation of membrane protease activity
MSMDGPAGTIFIYALFILAGIVAGGSWSMFKAGNKKAAISFVIVAILLLVLGAMYIAGR